MENSSLPISRRYDHREPHPIKIPNPENKVVIMWLHGFGGGYDKDNCQNLSVPPPIAELGNENTYIYFLCSEAQGEGYYTFRTNETENN